MHSTSAWVITDGINAGVMKYVGEVLEEVRTNRDENNGVCIGIIPWNIITDKDKLKAAGDTVKYNISSSFNKGGSCLNNNHTHFLLVDQDPKNHCNAEIDFRAVLQSTIRNTEVHGMKLRLEGASKAFFLCPYNKTN